MSVNLTSHFTFEELTRTGHDDLQKLNAVQASEYIDNLTNLCNYVLEPLRNILGKPISINSGFRGKALNARVNGSATSQHCFGEAADIHVEGLSANELFNFIAENKGIFTGYLGQCILEKVGGAEWVHISLKTDRYKQVLISRYGSDDSVFLTTVDGKNYERVA